jgi:ribosomal protein S18 acetylase RimI-like enzyme
VIWPPSFKQIEAIENICFKQDRLSKRSLKYFLNNHRIIQRPEGFIIYTIYKTHIRIYNIAVLSAYRGKGIARKLIGYLGDNVITLECKQHLKPFYEKLGFTVIGEIPDYYENGEKCLRMRKERANGLGETS